MGNVAHVWSRGHPSVITCEHVCILCGAAHLCFFPQVYQFFGLCVPVCFYVYQCVCVCREVSLPTDVCTLDHVMGNVWRMMCDGHPICVVIYVSSYISIVIYVPSIYIHDFGSIILATYNTTVSQASSPHEIWNLFAGKKLCMRLFCAWRSTCCAWQLQPWIFGLREHEMAPEQQILRVGPGGQNYTIFPNHVHMCHVHATFPRSQNLRHKQYL